MPEAGLLSGAPEVPATGAFVVSFAGESHLLKWWSGLRLLTTGHAAHNVCVVRVATLSVGSKAH